MLPSTSLPSLSSVIYLLPISRHHHPSLLHTSNRHPVPTSAVPGPAQRTASRIAKHSISREQVRPARQRLARSGGDRSESPQSQSDLGCAAAAPQAAARAQRRSCGDLSALISSPIDHRIRHRENHRRYRRIRANVSEVGLAFPRSPSVYTGHHARIAAAVHRPSNHNPSTLAAGSSAFLPAPALGDSHGGPLLVAGLVVGTAQLAQV